MQLALALDSRMSEQVHTCNMCCYTFRHLDLLAAHIISKHKDDPQFNVYCKLCLRSYTKWDSYRKHVQRGCSGCSTVLPNVSSPSSQLEIEECNDEDLPEVQPESSSIVNQSWHEAAFILNIKEQYVVSQAVIDHMLSSTKILVSNLLSGIINDLGDIVPIETMELIKSRIRITDTSLFNGLTTACLQKSFFKQHFDLVVSL